MVLIDDIETFDIVEDSIIQKIDIEEAHSFFMDNKHSMNISSRKNFASAIGIPGKYFAERNSELQTDMLLDAISEIDDKDSLFILSHSNAESINFHVGNEKEYQNPVKSLKLDQDYIKISHDYNKGRLKYFKGVQSPKLETTSGFIPGVYVTFPIFFNKQISFNVGMYRLVCRNGLMDRINCSDMTLRSGDFNYAMFEPLVNGIINGLKGYVDHYNEYMEYLQNKHMSDADVRKLLEEYKNTGSIPKGVINGCYRHLNRMEKDRKLPENSPEYIKNAYDFVNLLTFYSHESMNSIASRETAEVNIFRITHKMFTEETNKERFDLNLYNTTQLAA